MDTIIEAYTHTYWPNDPAVRVLTERTFRSPTFLDGYARILFARAAALPFQTPAEILYWWRNSVSEPVREGRLPFLPTQQEFSEFLAIGRSTYKLLEQLQAVPSDERAARIADRLGRPVEEKAAFLEACRRMRGHLISEDS